MPRPAGRRVARPISRALVALIALIVAIGPVSAAPGGPGVGADTRVRPGTAAPIEDGLLERLRSGATSRFVVEFAAKASLSRARRIADFDARGRAVVNALRAAARSQAEAIDVVESTGGARAESFWLRNTLVVTGPADLARSLARLPGVAQVRAERIFPLVKPVETSAAILQEGSEPEWGVAKIGADAVWEQGITGSGIVVANIDTGVDYTHDALVNQYRGNLGGGSFDHDYSWWDPTGICGPEPCDNAQHGTHTMGTMVGGDGAGPFTPDVGVAPGARWIAAKGCEDLFCTEGSLLSSGQFILAPTDVNGANPDPSRRPDIVNNSWGAGPGDPFYADVVSAWRAAGIVPVFSAGNAGPGCNSGGSPGDFLSSFSAGATDESDLIADFSSRGPSPFGKINPDVSAPGVDVTSTIPGGGYASFSGTSMAAPHVAGTLALVMSAELSLVGQIDPATAALRDTAVDILDDQCGGEEDGDPNNVYGDGRIDALAAVNLVATGGTLAGTVTDAAAAGVAIAGATVSAHNGSRTFHATTDADGTYELFLAAGSYTVTAEAFGYAASTAENVVVETDTTTTNNFALTALPRFVVSGHVTAISDGEPIENASVRAIGTPVDPAITDATGAYSLELPLGSYTLRASAGGCTEFAFAEIDLVEDVTVDFEVARKLDAFGHGCAPIAFTWDDAQTQTALFGTDFAGRLRLPFEFPFYGETYSQVFISDNGYLNFQGQDQFNPSPVQLPNEAAPNAAIYPLWQDLRVGPGGAIEYASLGDEPNRAFVIEYDDVSGGGEHSFAVKLWENGDIDLVYDDAGTGDNAGIGIENEDGTDALQVGFLSDVLTNDSAWRITEVPTGLLTGTVTDANDGLPIKGAEVEVFGSGRTVRTNEDGQYAVRLLPGTYTLNVNSPGYMAFAQEFTIAVGEELVIDVVLDAPIGSVEPTEITAEVALGETTTVPVTIQNTGTGILDWTARERPTGFVPPELPTIDGNPIRPPKWGRVRLPAGLPQAETSTIPDELLDVVIDDPADDSAGSVEVTTVRAGSDQAEITMEIDFASGVSQAAGFVMLDVDQDASTGVPPDAFAGLPTQEVGVEYFVSLFEVHEPEPVAVISDAFTFEIVAIVPARVDDTSVGFDVPLEAIGGDDGNVNTALTIGDFFEPLDWAPDVGFGVIEAFTDAPWISASPESGFVPAGESTVVDVTLGGEDVDAGEYTGRLVFASNDPKSPPMIVTLALTVGLPDAFGSLSGTVLDAHTGEPLRATVTVEAERDGEPYPVAVTTAEDGTYTAFAPAGTWPVTASKDNFVPVTVDGTLTAGVDTPGLDFALHRRQPHATVDGGPLEFVLLPDRTDEATLVIGNPEGHLPLDFSVAEVDLTPPPVTEPLGGVGSWVSPPEATTEGRANTGGTSARPSSFRWVPDNATTDLSVLVYADDPIHPAPDTFIDQALQQLGIAYTAHYDADFGGFESDLASGTWDVVIFANDNWGPDTSTFDALQAYVEGGGKLIAHSWVMADTADHPLWALMGVAHVSDDTNPPDPVFWWQPSHPAFSIPESVPELTELDALDFQVYGQHVDGGGGEPIAGYTTPGPDPGEAALVIGPSRTTVFRGFIDAQNSADLDGDGLSDGVELWVNLISGIEFGFVSDISWLTIDPLEGTVEADSTAGVTVTADSSGLAPGVYQGAVIVQTSDPDNRSMAVPVSLVVPAYRVGINAGGGRSTTADGIFYSSDRGYGRGPFGWSGRINEVFRTDSAISGTEEDLLYKSLRQGMRAYRFDVPEGTYLVDLQFAEIMARPTGTRVFTVFIEDEPVLVNLDVWKEVGKNAAYDRSFVVDVTDGRLDIVFSGQQGDKPMISAILVTHRPDFGGE